MSEGEMYQWPNEEFGSPLIHRDGEEQRTQVFVYGPSIAADSVVIEVKHSKLNAPAEGFRTHVPNCPCKDESIGVTAEGWTIRCDACGMYAGPHRSFTEVLASWTRLVTARRVAESL